MFAVSLPRLKTCHPYASRAVLQRAGAPGRSPAEARRGWPTEATCLSSALAQEQAENLAARFRIHCTRGLIGKHYQGIGNEPPGHGHALLLAHAEFGGQMVGAARQVPPGPAIP